MKILVLSTSLNPESKSREMAGSVKAYLESSLSKDDSLQFVDMRDYPLPLCDGGAAYGDANVKQLGAMIAESALILVAFPVYNYSFSAVLKNLIELTGKAWENKIVGMLCAAGGKSSYMSAMGLANSLMLDFRTMIVPRFVYTDGDINEPKIQARLRELVDDSLRIARALQKN